MGHVAGIFAYSFGTIKFTNSSLKIVGNNKIIANNKSKINLMCLFNNFFSFHLSINPRF